MTYSKKFGGVQMARAIFNEDRCKGCELCISVCPKKIVAIACDRINKKGFNPAYVTDQSKCIGCAFCAMICPDLAIEVEK